jgi:hypothetical protein
MRLLWCCCPGGDTALPQVPERRLTMKPSTLYAIALGIVSGIAVAYIEKCKKLKRQNDEQADEIDRLKNYIMEETLI